MMQTGRKSLKPSTLLLTWKPAIANRSRVRRCSWFAVNYWRKHFNFLPDTPAKVCWQSLRYTGRSIFWKKSVNFGFYRAILCRARYSSGNSSVRLSVRPFVRSCVTLVDCDHRGWNSSKIMSRLDSPGRSLSADIMDLLQREHPAILVGIGWVSKKWLSAYKSSNISIAAR